MKKMKWVRENEGLFLYIQDNDVWVRYNRHPAYISDYALSSNSGFRTAQRLLKLGYDFLPLNE